MSLEQTIQELNTSILALLDTVNSFAKQPITNQLKQPTAHIVEEVTIADLKETTTSPEHLRVELQEICSSKIVKDRSLKDQIKAIIAQYDGATHLAKVPDANLVDLRNELLALK
tara:strand:+ start:108 stop:449 length:342 start_codon:yes stop_codon:yes gene_type:complete